MTTRVLILLSSLHFGGAERHAIQLANHLPKEHFDVHLVYLKAREELIAELKLDADKIWCARFGGGLDMAGFLRLRQHIKRVAPAIVLCVNSYPLLYAWLAKASMRSRFALVEVFHSTILAPADDARMRRIYRPLFNAVDQLVYVSEAQRRYWRARGVAAKSEVAIHNGIDLTRFSAESVGFSVGDAKVRLGIVPDCFTIGLCAVFRPEKAHEDLLQAVALLKREGLCCRVLLIGDGPCRPSIERCIANLGLQREVTITGFQPDVRPYLLWRGVAVYKAYHPTAGIPGLRFIHPRWTGIWAAMKRADADVYYTSCAGMMVGLMAMFCRVHGRGLVFRLAHDTDADPDQLLIRYRRDKWLYSYGLRKANGVLSQHGFQQAALLKNYGVSSHVADMLVDPPARELVLPERDVSVLWVNNLRDFKRPDLALELARLLPHRHIHMVGGPQPGFQALYETTQREAAFLPNLTFHGRIPYHDVGDYYDRARVFINTSDSEGFPNSYLQSWRRGVPVVAFFDPDGLIRREGLGYAVSGMDEMQQAVEKLLSDDSEWQRVSARCRAYMERHHGDDVVLGPYLTAIELAHSARRPA